jgi:hypothetical protein
LVWVLLGLAAILPHEASSQTLTIEETEALVRAVYFEGMPEDPARRIGPAGSARLIEMLVDPEEKRAHANILLALGLSGQPDASAAILDWAALPREGEIDRDTFRAWQALPYALAHVARYDRRAVAQLERQLEGEAPSWTFRHHRGAKLDRLGRRAAASALGLSGVPEARGALDRAGQRASDPGFDKHLRNARELHQRRAVQAPR